VAFHFPSIEQDDVFESGFYIQ